MEATGRNILIYLTIVVLVFLEELLSFRYPASNSPICDPIPLRYLSLRLVPFQDGVEEPLRPRMIPHPL